ncbi:beta-microseminoprotein-like [Leptodactylus fuscus]|uniref:beta-microseminoprotein-like n=1 Tax=Leptodactylus fuscus TaxID=238119 RepID=UPI003F4E93E1
MICGSQNRTKILKGLRESSFMMEDRYVYLLRILVAVTIITLCSAQCVLEYHRRMSFNAHTHAVYGQRNNGCLRDGQRYKVGETWTMPPCMRCTCQHDYIECCPNYARPILQDSDNCEKRLNEEICQMEIKQKDNSDTPCEVDFWIA